MHTGRLIPTVVLLAVMAGACAGLLAACAGSPPGAKPAASSSGVPAFRHVFLIVGENTSASQITPSHAPYLTGTLKARAAWLSRYSSFPKSSSLGQYTAMVSGRYTKCESNNDLPAHCHRGSKNLFQQLDKSGRSWRMWAESMDNACDYVDHGSAWSRNIYSAHHNPALYFTGVEGGVYDEAKTPKSECRNRVLSTGTTAPNDTAALDSALKSGNVGNFDMISPNDCENGHDPCGGSDPVRQFDAFLKREVPKIEASPAYGPDSLIVITWDEGADPPKNPKHPLTVLLGSKVKLGTYAAAYSHYNLARTLEDAFRVPHLAHAAKARAITGVWK